MFEIESGIPIPRPRLFGKNRTGMKQAICNLKPGDSFVVQIGDYASHAAAASTVSTQARAVGVRVATRKIDAETMRVWRVE